MRDCAILISIIFLFPSCSENSPHFIKLYIGTYTNGSSEGIYTVRFNTKTGELDSLALSAKLPNPSFLALSKDNSYLYAVQETSDFDHLVGGVTAFAINQGELSVLNSKSSGGAHPCHVALSSNGQLAVSNYTGGNLAIFDLEENGSLGNRQLLDHNAVDFTQKAHVHQAVFNKHGLFVSDLGLDQIKRYTKEPYGWIPVQEPTLQLPNGAGPRHITFNTKRSFLYVLNELNSTITVFQQNAEGDFATIQTESTLDSDYKGNNACADIHLSPDGQFLYASNRGENTLVIFSVDQVSGKLTLVDRQSVRGDWPRNFTLSPDGRFVLVANERSHNISVFKRDMLKGTLKYTHKFELGSPVCLVFEYS